MSNGRTREQARALATVQKAAREAIEKPAVFRAPELLPKHPDRSRRVTPATAMNGDGTKLDAHALRTTTAGSGIRYVGELENGGVWVNPDDTSAIVLEVRRRLVRVVRDEGPDKPDEEAANHDAGEKAA